MRSTFFGLMLAIAGCLWVDPWERLQHDFLEKIPSQDEFPLAHAEDTLHLPLPARPLSPDELKVLLSGLQQQVATVDPADLDDTERIQLSAIQRTLDSLQTQVAQHGILRADPAVFCVDGLLQHFSGDEGVVRHPGLMVKVVEQIPVYYQEVQQRGFQPDIRQIPEALEASQHALDALDLLEGYRLKLSVGYRERFDRALPAARRAVKDYIAYCMSGWVE